MIPRCTIIASMIALLLGACSGPPAQQAATECPDGAACDSLLDAMVVAQAELQRTVAGVHFIDDPGGQVPFHAALGQFGMHIGVSHAFLLSLDEEVDQLNKLVTVDSVSTDPITGIGIEKFRSMIELIPFEGELKENVTSTISLFGQFLVERPNFLMIDPNSENATSLLIFKSYENYNQDNSRAHEC